MSLAAPAIAAEGDWRGDAPGVKHRIDASALPQPYVTHSAVECAADRAAASNGAVPKAPPGSAVKLFADNLRGPRVIRVAPNGDIFVAESKSDRIHVLRPDGEGGKIAQDAVFTDNLNLPFGIAFYPPGNDPQFIYVGNTDGIVRIPYRKAATSRRAANPKAWFAISGRPGGHWTRDVVFSPDGKKMFVSVGSGSNVAEGLADRSAKFIADFESHHGRGAAWDREENRADVLVFDPDGQNMETFATGIRNCVSIAVKPRTDGSLWCATNERDWAWATICRPTMSPKYTRGAFYGWPWYYIGDNEDPRHPAARGRPPRPYRRAGHSDPAAFGAAASHLL